MLVEWRKSGDASGRVFPGSVPGHHTFRSDLEAAGIRRVDDRGRKVDFHALRVTFITNLYRAGVPQRQAMALARHTDPRLTANIYTDQDALPLAEAVAKLPTYGLDATHKHAFGPSRQDRPDPEGGPEVLQSLREVRNRGVHLDRAPAMNLERSELRTLDYGSTTTSTISMLAKAIPVSLART